MTELEAAALAGHYAHVVARGGTLTPEQGAELATLLQGSVAAYVQLDQQRQKREASRKATAERVAAYRARQATVTPVTDVTQVTPVTRTSVTEQPASRARVKGKQQKQEQERTAKEPSQATPAQGGDADASAADSAGGASSSGPYKPANPNSAPWMGLVRPLWAKFFPGSEPPPGTAKQLRPAMRDHGPEFVIPRLEVLLASTPASALNLGKFAATCTSDEFDPDPAVRAAALDAKRSRASPPRELAVNGARPRGATQSDFAALAEHYRRLEAEEDAA